MAITNRDRVGKAMDCLGTGLAAYVERELRVVFGDKWKLATVARRNVEPLERCFLEDTRTGGTQPGQRAPRRPQSLGAQRGFQWQ